MFCPNRDKSPPCSWQWPCCGRASLGSSGLGNIDVHGQLHGRWNAICWNIWSARLRTSTGSAAHTWRRSRSMATPQNAEHRFGSTSKLQNSPIFLNINTSQITWIISKSPRHGQADVRISIHPLIPVWYLNAFKLLRIMSVWRNAVFCLYPLMRQTVGLNPSYNRTEHESTLIKIPLVHNYLILDPCFGTHHQNLIWGLESQTPDWVYLFNNINTLVNECWRNWMNDLGRYVGRLKEQM